MTEKTKIGYSLQLKLLCIILLLTVLPLSIITFIIVRNWKKDLTFSKGHIISLRSQGLADKIQNDFIDIINTVSYWNEEAEMNEVLFDDKDMILTNKLVDKKIIYSDFVEEIFCLNNNGVIVAASNPKYLGDSSLKENKEFMRGKNNITYTSEVTYFDIIKKKTILISSPIRPFDKKSRIGVTMVFLKFDQFDRSMNKKKRTEKLLQSLLIDKNGYIFGSPPSYRRLFLFNGLIQSLGFNLKEITSSINKDGYILLNNKLLDEDFLIGYAPVNLEGKNNGWSVLTLEYAKVAYSSISSIVVWTIYIFLGLIITVVLVSIYTTKKVTSPIKNMHEAMEIISVKKHLSAEDEFKLSYSSNDELGVMAKSFNRMIASLRQKDTIIYERSIKLEKTNTELRDLTENLEKKVKERTSDLEVSNLRLRQSQKKLVQMSISLKRVNKNLEKMSRLKSEFISNISHELRTPLNAVINFANQIIADWNDLREDNVWFTEAKSMLEMVEKNGKHLLSFINSILDLDKIESGNASANLAKGDIKKEIHEAVLSISSLIQKKEITIKEVFSEDIEEFFFDQLMIKQVLLNLLSNAIKFTPKGAIQIDAKIKQGLEKQKVVVVTVDDSGIGIKKEHFKSIFTRFHQIDGSISKTYKGTGLGLSICKEFLELQGGKIYVKSEINTGSTFTFEIPYRKVGQKDIQ